MAAIAVIKTLEHAWKALDVAYLSQWAKFLQVTDELREVWREVYAPETPPPV